MALLRRNDSGLFELEPAVRRRWIDALPEAPTERGSDMALIMALSAHAERLEPQERAAFEVKLRAMDDSPVSQKLRWLGLVSLFGPEAPHLESEARELLLAHLSEERMAVVLASSFLSALGTIDLQRLGAEVEALLLRAAEHGGSAQGVILSGLARVALQGPHAVRAPARELLGQLAARPEFREDAGVREVLRMLNLPEPTP